MAERKLQEITREDFWRIEDAIVEMRHLHISGTLTVERTDDGKTYRNAQGIWLKSHKGMYFAHATMKKLAK
jgi:hypothetical protein